MLFCLLYYLWFHLKNKTDMNWKIFTLALILFVTGALTGAFIQYRGFSNGYDNATEAMKPIISQAIDKETISNTISNAIDLKIDKIKKSDTLVIDVNQQPANDQKPTNTFNKNCDCKVTKAQFKKLTDSRQRRLSRWLEE